MTTTTASNGIRSDPERGRISRLQASRATIAWPPKYAPKHTVFAVCPYSCSFKKRGLNKKEVTIPLASHASMAFEGLSSEEAQGR